MCRPQSHLEAIWTSWASLSSSLLLLKTFSAETGGLCWGKQSVLFQWHAVLHSSSKSSSNSMHCPTGTNWQTLAIHNHFSNLILENCCENGFIKKISSLKEMNNTKRFFLSDLNVTNSIFSKCHNQHWEESPTEAGNGWDGDCQDKEGGLCEDPGAASQQGAEVQIRVWGKVGAVTYWIMH